MIKLPKTVFDKNLKEHPVDPSEWQKCCDELVEKLKTETDQIQRIQISADVYRYQNDFRKSECVFDQAKALLSISKVSESLRGSFEQHLGKFYFDQNYYKLALCHFELAAKIRHRIYAPADQVESTDLAIAECRHRISEEN